MNLPITQQTTEQLVELIELFRDNIAQYKSQNYDEANTRTDFIDKFFELLGWDVRNTAGYSEQYRDVIREDSVKIDNRPKAPDYAFRIGGYRKFFVEAKKPSVYIHDDIVPAFQVRRYGYTAKLPLSILTDFEELAVYDTRIKPHHTDKASVARIFYCKYTDYLEKFDFLYNTFSKEAVLRGSFDRYVQENKNKKGTSEVDTELLALVEEWRLTLAKNISKQNPELDAYHLNTAVQRIVDRILFLRIAEDRRIERYENLWNVATKPEIYAGLQHLFVDADEKYNAGLFRQEDWLSKIAVDDKVLSPIIKGLYYPESPYEFSVLPIEILGSIYERFLGKTIILSPSHVAKVEEKPEVRKAGGVYYTPQYIVDYIVAETVGRKFETPGTRSSRPQADAGGTPAFRQLPTILDSACGSGSFLVGAYTFLLDNFLSYYSDEKNLKKSLKTGLIYEAGKETYRLSIEEKQRILLASIYGVDIDPIAVEVTKLSLYLKLLENETEESAGLLFKHSDMKMLPNLDKNIRCGNSLVGSDYYCNKEMPLFGDAEIRQINAFDWEKEFPHIFENNKNRSRKGGAQHRIDGSKPITVNTLPTVAPFRLSSEETCGSSGFDCVIGNPPYVRQETLDNATKEYFQTHYSVYHGTADLYAYFIEKGISLLKDGGNYGVIVANKWLRANYGEPLRKWLKTWSMLEIVDFGDLPVFGKVTSYPMIFRVEKVRKNGEKLAISQVKSLDFETLAERIADKRQFIDTETLDDSGWQLQDGRVKKLFDKLMSVGVSLKEYVGGKIYRGVLTGLNEAFVIDAETRKRLIKEDKRSKEIIKPFLAGRDIKRYSPLETEKYLIFTRRGIDINEYPAIKAYLEQFRKQLTPKPKGWVSKDGKPWKGRAPGNYKWYELQTPVNYYAEFETPKIIFPDIALRMQATYDEGNNYCVNTAYIMPTDDKFLLSVINSQIIQFLLLQISANIRGGYLRFFCQYVERLPIPTLDLSDKKQKSKHDKLVSLVEQMLLAQERLRAAVSEGDRKTCTQRVEILDAQIDAIVYELYGLTEEDIRIVENV